MTQLPASQPFGARDFAVVAAMNILWGLNVVAVKMSVDEIAPLTAAALRQAIVLLVCITALRIVPGKMVELVGLGLLSGGVFYIIVNFSLAVSDNVPALAIAGQLGVPFALILAVLIQGERIRWPRIAGIALAFGGVVLLVFDPAAAREGPGLALTALASLIWAAGSLIQRRLNGVPVLTIYAWVGLGGSVMLFPLAAAFEPQTLRAVGSLPVSALGWVAFSAIGSTIGGHGAMSWLLQRHQVSVVTPLTLAAPIISVVTASLYFGTPVTAVMVAGGGVALLGVAVIAIRTARAGEAA